MRQSTKNIAYEAELAEKSREELQATHQANMDELDAINKRLLATLNRSDEKSAEKDEKAEEDEMDIEREAPLEETKFQEINNTELTELQTSK